MGPTDTTTGSRRAVFLDKDGTLVEDVPYNVDPRLVRLLPGAGDGLRRLQDAGLLLFVVSNQSGVARGLFPESALSPVEERLRGLLADCGVALDGFYYCPHHLEGVVAGYASHCDCRKPAPGLIRRAAAEHGLDLGRSWMVGDILDDVEAGRAAGCRTVLVDNGHETEWVLTPGRQPDLRAADLREAARLILSGGRPDLASDGPRRPGGLS
jgi:histidinol-phosphate phosphatase family protein